MGNLQQTTRPNIDEDPMTQGPKSVRVSVYRCSPFSCLHQLASRQPVESVTPCIQPTKGYACGHIGTQYGD